MMSEKKIQNSVLELLKKKGCYVIKTHPGLGTPTGAPDIIFFKGSVYGVLECKKTKDSLWRPLQLETLIKFKHWGVYARAVYKENLDDVLTELGAIL